MTIGATFRVLSFFVRVRTLVALTATVFSVAALVAASTPVQDPDVFWIAAAGRSMLATWSVPRSNAFSFVDPDVPWTMHESLLGPPYAKLVGWIGPAGFDLVAFVSLTTALVLVVMATVGRARRVDAGLAAAFGAISLFGFRLLTARPMGVSLVLPLSLVLLSFRPTFSVAAIFAAAAIECVWANAHGSFPLGLAILALAAIEGREDRPRRVLALALAALATAVNPYGLGLHRFVFEYLRGGEGIFREIALHIREFRSLPEAYGATMRVPDLIGCFAIIALVVGALRKPRHRLRASFCLILLVAGIRQARHFDLAGLFGFVLLVPYVDDLFDKWVPPIREMSRRAIAAIVVLPAVATGIVAFGIALATRAPDDWVGEGEPFVELVRSLPDGARTYAPFRQAGAVLWYAAPRGVRVFFDSRNDCYTPETARTFFALETGALSGADALAALDRTGTDAVLVPTRHPMTSSVAGKWQSLEERGRWRLFVRSSPRRKPETPVSETHGE